MNVLKTISKSKYLDIRVPERVKHDDLRGGDEVEP